RVTTVEFIPIVAAAAASPAAASVTIRTRARAKPSRRESIAYLNLFMARSSGHHRRRYCHADRSRQGRRAILCGDAVLVGCPPFDLPIPELVLLPAGCNAVVRLRALRVARNPSPDHVTDHITFATCFVDSRVPGESDLRFSTHDAPFREHRSPEDRRRPARL